jgi:CheY-like chemotaxis protein
MTPRLLIIEKDPGTRRLFEALARTQGWEADAVETGVQGSLLLHHAAYDALLIDLMAPGVSGTQLLEHLESTSPALLAAAIGVSASSEATLQTIRDRFPAVRVVRKPFELPEMVEILAGIRGEREPDADPFSSFVRKSVVAGARSGLVVETDGKTIELVRTFGYQPSDYEGYFPMSVDAAYPICTAIREERMVFVGTMVSAAAEYPGLETSLNQFSTRALAAVPLLHDDRVIGAAGWSFLEPRSFAEETRAQLQTIAGMAAPLLAQ